jgi:trk system potassium uptake protein
MYVIIAGCRKVGANLALELAQENHDVVVIDSDPERLATLGSGFNGVTIVGMPIDEDVLRSAGVEQADALAAVTDDDNMNIMVSQVAKELFAVPVIITRVYDPQREVFMSSMGLTTVCPTTLAVQKIKSQLLKKDTLDTLHISGTAVSFRLVKPQRRQLGQFIKETQNDTVLGLVRDRVFCLANDKATIQAGDLLVVAQAEPSEV